MPELLLVETDVYAARMVDKVLNPYGFNIHYAPTGAEGLQLAQSYPPDIILANMEQHDLEGKVIITTLRRLTAHRAVPIIAFTTESGARAKRLAIEAGYDSCISKPIDTRAFPGQIAEVLKFAREEGNL